MKRQKITFLLTLIMSIVGAKALAYDAEVDGLYYNISGSEATVTYMEDFYYSQSAAYPSNVVIPETVTISGNTYAVTKIDSFAFANSLRIYGVTIPNSVTSIGDYAFYECTWLSTVVIGNGVTTIGECAFWKCLSLSAINIPNSVVSIGQMAFSDCYLHSIQIGSGVKTIGSDAFYTKSSLTSIAVNRENPYYDSRDNCNALIETESNKLLLGCQNTVIPNSVTVIGNNSFRGAYSTNDNNVSLTIPEGVVTIGKYAFSDNQYLSSVSIPNSVYSIGSCAFENCTGLTTATIGDGVASIGASAFKGCTKLSSLNIPNSVATIGESSFRNCSSLSSITIPDDVSAIGSYTFDGCKKLSFVTIGEKVKTIGSSAFNDCGLRTVIAKNSVPAKISTWDTFSNRLIVTLYVPYGSKADYEGANYWKQFKSIVEIGDNSSIIIFADYNVKELCTSNWDLSGDGEMDKDEAAAVTDLGTVFKNNYNITSFDELQYFSGLTNIGESAFSSCSSLASITLPAGITAIGQYAFYNCNKMTSIFMPDGISSIGNYAFQSCSNLTSVTVEMEMPLPISSNTFSNRANAILYVPHGCKAAYEAANYWKEFKEIVEMEPTGVEVTDISQMDNVIYIEPTEARCGSQTTLSVKMKNDVAIQTIQFDLNLPDGITIVPNEDDELVTASKERINKFNYFDSSMQSDGALRLLAQATTTNVPAGDGEICRIVVDIPENMEEGDYPLVIKGALMVEMDNTSHSPDPNLVQTKLTVLNYVSGDASNDGDVNAIDFNMIGNYILGRTQNGFNMKAADISGDGDVNAIDFNMVGNMILNGSTASARERRTEYTKDPE